jgi:hypothetical protein
VSARHPTIDPPLMRIIGSLAKYDQGSKTVPICRQRYLVSMGQQGADSEGLLGFDRSK